MPRTELAGLPVGGPATRDTVKEHLGITDARDDSTIDRKVAAVNSLVRSWPVSLSAVDAAEWPEVVVEGATLLASRWFRRKGSPAGVEGVGADQVVYIQKTDPDVATMLELGSWQGPSA